MKIFGATPKDKQVLSQAKDKQFIEHCINEFGEKPLPTTNREKVKVLTFWSYLPNLVSITTACFFVVYLLQSYTLSVQLLLSLLLCGVAIALEVGKRGLIAEMAKAYFVDGKLAFLLLAGCIVLMAGSMAASYIGGNKLVISTATPPAPEVNPKIDSLLREVSTLNTSIKKQEGTTWKGRITSDANKAINNLLSQKNTLLAQLNSLETKDSETYSETLSQYHSKILNFGVALGIIAVFADAVLFALIWTVKRLKHDITLLASTSPGHRSTRVQWYQSHQGGVRDVPTVGESFSDNQHQEPQKRKIGFKVGRSTEKRTTEKRKNEKPLDEAPAPEVVTVVEREVVELTDRVKECEHCGNKFAYYNSRAKYCSDGCRIAAWEERTGRKLKKVKK